MKKFAAMFLGLSLGLFVMVGCGETAAPAPQKPATPAATGAGAAKPDAKPEAKPAAAAPKKDDAKPAAAAPAPKADEKK